MAITVYEKPTCTTCRKLATLLRDNGVDYDKVNYFIEPFDAPSLTALLAKAGVRPFDALRKGETVAKELNITAETPDAEVIRLMIENPGLLQRPIVEVGDKAVIARPIERALEIIK